MIITFRASNKDCTSVMVYTEQDFLTTSNLICSPQNYLAVSYNYNFSGMSFFILRSWKIKRPGISKFMEDGHIKSNIFNQVNNFMNSREKLDYELIQTLHKTTESILAAELSIQPTSKQKIDKKWQSLPIRISNYPPIQLRPYRSFFFSHLMLVPLRRSD